MFHLLWYVLFFYPFRNQMMSLTGTPQNSARFVSHLASSSWHLPTYTTPFSILFHFKTFWPLSSISPFDSTRGVLRPGNRKHVLFPHQDCCECCADIICEPLLHFLTIYQLTPPCVTRLPLRDVLLSALRSSLTAMERCLRQLLCFMCAREVAPSRMNERRTVINQKYFQNTCVTSAICK